MRRIASYELLLTQSKLVLAEIFYYIAPISRGGTEETDRAAAAYEARRPVFASAANFIFVRMYDVMNLFLRKNLHKSLEP